MINATSGISCTKNVKFSSGISAISGIKGALPESYQAYYPFTSDFFDQVSGDYFSAFDNQPSFGGGGINTVANTNLQVTTFQKDGKGVYLDEPPTATIPCVISSFTSGSFVNGIDIAIPAMTFITTTPVTGKYQGLVVSSWIGAILTASNGAKVKVASIVNDRTFTFNIIKGSDSEIQAGFGNDGTSSNPFTIDFSFSGYYPSETGPGSAAEVRTNAGDDVTGFPTSLPWDTSGDFRYGYIGIGRTVADISGQVLLQTGNMGISTGIGITFAEIGASISALSVTSDTIVGECFLKYVSGMLSIVIDGVESTPVASAAPTIGAFAQEGANTSNLSPAPGTYGGLLFEVL